MRRCVDTGVTGQDKVIVGHSDILSSAHVQQNLPRVIQGLIQTQEDFKCDALDAKHSVTNERKLVVLQLSVVISDISL